MQTEIAKVMSIKGITNKSLARSLDVTDVAICEWKRGRVCVPPGRRKQLADALGVEVDDGEPRLSSRCLKNFTRVPSTNALNTCVGVFYCIKVWLICLLKQMSPA
jgi:hypothetical protein